MIRAARKILIIESGYTLIEVIIFMALFSLVIGGLLVITYSIVDGSGKLQSKAVVEEEGAFLIRKINWALMGAESISQVGTALTINNPTLPFETPLVFDLDINKNITLKTGAGSAVAINSESIAVSSLQFTYTPPGSGKPANVQTRLTLSSLGENVVFESSKYLRK